MKCSNDFDEGNPGESIFHTFDFRKGDLSDGEDIVSVVGGAWQASVAPDSPNPDPNAASIVDGIATTSIDQVYQRITFAADNPVNVKYILLAQVVTNLGNTPILYAHKWCRAPR